MRRPYISYKIVQLEELFSSTRDNTTVLRNLQAELQHRNVPRALGLLEQVEAVLASLRSPGPDAAAVAKQSEQGTQPDLWGRRQGTSAPEKLTLPPMQIQPTNESAGHDPNEAARPMARPSEMGAGGPTITVEDAYRLLRVAATSKWETVELARRTIVQAAHPDAIAKLPSDRQEQLKRAAKRANAAYLVLLAGRLTLATI